MADDRSRDVSAGLTEVRTVCNRARSAIDKLDGEYAGEYYRTDDARWDGQHGNEGFRAWHDAHFIFMADPDHDDMREALLKVVELLERWDKRGARRRR